MPTPKQPQDHKPKAAEASDRFTFEHDGETYELKPTLEHITPGFLRRIRKLGDLDAFYTILEALADDEQLEVIDVMSFEEFGQLNKDFFAHLGALRGESTGS
jgi:hypothetical protein